MNHFRFAKLVPGSSTRQRLKVKLSCRIKFWEFEKGNLTKVMQKDLEDLGN